MIKEIKKKKTKFGSIVSFAKDDAQVAELIKHNSISGYIIVHRIGVSDNRGAGQLIVGHRQVPKFKNVVGHYISQFRGGELVAFIGNGVTLLEDASKMYDFVDANKMDRAYAMFLGDPKRPSAVVMSSTLIEHLFQSTPDALDVSGDWISFIHGWLRKSLLGGRYFDGNGLVSAFEKLPEVPQVKPASEYQIAPEAVETPAITLTDDSPRTLIAADGKVITEPEADMSVRLAHKKRPDRPKTKK